MAALDDRIDELYRRPLAEFTRARNDLAASLTGDARARVKHLAKPTVVPWAVDQLYWRARPVFDRLRESGTQLRDAQVKALRGQKADVRAATAAHRRAVADAVQKAIALAGEAGSKPGADALTRMLEGISLVRDLPEPAGRFTQPIEPQGFGALAGFAPEDGGRATHATGGHAGPRHEPPRESKHASRQDAAHARREAARARQEEAERRRAIAHAERRAREAKAALERAAERLDTRRADLERATRAEAAARDAHARAAAEASEAQSALDRLRP